MRCAGVTTASAWTRNALHVVEQDTQCTCNVTLRHFHVTIVDGEKQQELHVLCVSVVLVI